MTIETWLPVTGYEGLYSVSDAGRVRSEDRISRHRTGSPSRRKGQMIKPQMEGKGYFRVGLSKDGKVRMTSVAHIVAAAFIGPRPKGLEVCHGDGVRTNNALCNLRFDSPAGNAADKRLHGTLLRGEDIGNSKLSEAEAIAVRGASGTQREIAMRFGIAQSQVSLIKSGARWSHLKEAMAQCYARMQAGEVIGAGA